MPHTKTSTSIVLYYSDLFGLSSIKSSQATSKFRKESHGKSELETCINNRSSLSWSESVHQPVWIKCKRLTPIVKRSRIPSTDVLQWYSFLWCCIPIYSSFTWWHGYCECKNAIWAWVNAMQYTSWKLPYVQWYFQFFKSLFNMLSNSHLAVFASTRLFHSYWDSHNWCING